MSRSALVPGWAMAIGHWSEPPDRLLVVGDSPPSTATGVATHDRQNPEPSVANDREVRCNAENERGDCQVIAAGPG